MRLGSTSKTRFFNVKHHFVQRISILALNFLFILTQLCGAQFRHLIVFIIKMNEIEAQAIADAKDAVVNTVKTNRMKGMKIRDEFICPITYELMREPVVASDGHTYEKNAIEKWLKTSHTSPRNGETIDGTIIPNYNLKKLIQDIINEVGCD